MNGIWTTTCVRIGSSAFVEGTLGLAVTHDLGCPACGGRGIVIPGELRAATERLATLIADAPSVDVTLDQCPCTPQTAILRALLMLKTGALEGRRVLVLGDDDSLSIAIGLVGRALHQRDLTRGVTVIESDPRRVAGEKHGEREARADAFAKTPRDGHVVGVAPAEVERERVPEMLDDERVGRRVGVPEGRLVVAVVLDPLRDRRGRRLLAEPSARCPPASSP
jgi:hypothetical protein